MSDWPYYESHKVVQAARIVAIELRPTGRLILVRADGCDDELQEFRPSVPGMADKAEVGGYAVLYPDGFRSISPARQFEEGYTRRP